jgi:hypothetical protein
VSDSSKLPGWTWALIILASLGGVLLLAMVLVFLWPWVVATG